MVQGQQEGRRAHLIRATWKEISQKGFSDVTLDHIAARARVSKGVALYYFDSKEELFLSAFEYSITALRDRLRAAIAAAPGPVEKMQAMIRTTFVGVRENRTFYRAYLDFLSLGTRHEAFHRLNERFYKGCRAMDTEIVEAGIRQGIFRADADPSVPRAVFDGLMLQWLFDDPGAFDQYRKRCEEAVLTYLKA